MTADGMWLGPDLLARVDRSALEKVARVELQGPALYVTPRDGTSLDELERVLAPTLASGENWQSWMAWIYGRGERPF